MSLDDRKVYSEQCTRCSQCKFVPTLQNAEFATACPSMDYGEFHAYSAGGKLITSFGYNLGKIPANSRMIESIYACTLCGACDTACKTNQGDNVEPFDTLLEMRARMVEDGHVPEPLKKMVENLEAEGTPKGLRINRSLWAEGLNIKDARKEPVEVLIHVGSENAYDESQWDYLRFIVRLLVKANVDFGFTYDSESDSGGLAYELGFRNIAEQLADDCLSLVRKSKAKTLLALDVEAYSSLNSIYPRIGKSLKGVNVLHATEFVEDLLQSGRVSLSFSNKDNGIVAYHDACRLGRRSETHIPWVGEKIRVLNTLLVTDSPHTLQCGVEGNYDAPRDLLSRIEGLNVVDFTRSREFSYCCGGGCGVKETYPAMSDKAALQCFAEAESIGAKTIVTGSGGCQQHMDKTAKHHNKTVKVTSLFDLLAESLIGEV